MDGSIQLTAQERKMLLQAYRSGHDARMLFGMGAPRGLQPSGEALRRSSRAPQAAQFASAALITLSAAILKHWTSCAPRAIARAPSAAI